MSTRQDIVIIGGGLTGLSAAYYAWHKAKEQGQQASITVIEQAQRLGGKIDTLRKEQCVIEKGPDSFLARKLPMVELAISLGMKEELVATNPNAKKTYILCDGKLHSIPSGTVLGIPTELEAFLESTLVSEEGKQVALRDLELEPRLSTEDEALGSFLDRRLGREVTEHIAEPLLAGIYAGNMNELSLQATFPQFGELEREHGSIIRGMTANRQAGVSLPGLPDVARGTTFLTFRNGLSSLVERLEAELQQHVQLLCGVSAEELTHEMDGSYMVRLSNGSSIICDQVIVTTQAYHAAPLLKSLTDVTMLEGIKYVSVANVVSAFDRDQLPGSWDGTGFVIARKEGRAITACTWTSTKWTHTSPEDTMLIRCYIGRAGDEARVNGTDEELKRVVQAELRELLGIEATPRFVEITRLNQSMPQYPVGHVQQLAAFRQQLTEQLPGLFVAGAAYDGVGMPDCIRSGRAAGEVAAEQSWKQHKQSSVSN